MTVVRITVRATLLRELVPVAGDIGYNLPLPRRLVAEARRNLSRPTSSCIQVFQGVCFKNALMPVILLGL